MTDRRTRLSRKIAHALRHKPERYGLTLDAEGWVELADLAAALARAAGEWRDLSAEELRALVAEPGKQRYQIAGDRIRALYGHSTSEKIAKAEAVPPDRLYHGTTPEALTAIRRAGLKPMRRQYVHLSPDRETAETVARRRSDDPVILTVLAKEAHADGALFHRGNESVWLAGAIAPQYLLLPDGEIAALPAPD